MMEVNDTNFVCGQQTSGGMSWLECYAPVLKWTVLLSNAMRFNYETAMTVKIVGEKHGMNIDVLRVM